jgi:hypothetical protein
MARPRQGGALAPDFDPARAVRLILMDYERFLASIQEGEVGDAKSFAGRHAAGRAALTHAEHVVKIAALVCGADTAPDLAALLAAARAQLNQEGESDDDPATGEG